MEPISPLYRLDLCYVGTQFQGWQSQPDRSGVQDRLEEVMAIVLRHPVRVTGASRTDSGVHAEHQVASFRTHVAIEPRRFIKSLNSLLPKDVAAMKVAPVPPDFHPIVGSLGKAYRYRLWLGSYRSPYVSPFVWPVSRDLDLDALAACGSQFVGTHDFSSFCASDSSAKTKTRTIFEVAVLGRGPLVDIWIVGNGFLKQMVRAIVGTMVEMVNGKFPGQTVASLLEARDRRVTGITAPAQGLSLVRIFYDRIQSVSELRQQAEAGFTMPLMGD